MNPLLFILLIQFQDVKQSWHSFCERNLIADNPYDEAEWQEKYRKMRLLSPEAFEGRE